MMRYSYLIFALLILAPQLTFAQGIRLPSDTVLNFDLPSSRWEVSTEAPELAIEAMVVDMVKYREKDGKEFDRAELTKKAEKLIKVNNLYIYNKATEAYLMVSFSPHGRAESPLNKAAIDYSVDWSIDALNDHADVEDISGYKTIVEEVEIPGIEYAQQITSDNPLFGDPHNFIGVIGYNYPYWIFMFYNDKAKDPKDFKEMQQIIKSIKLAEP
jgi:hypothetical protein